MINTKDMNQNFKKHTITIVFFFLLFVGYSQDFMMQGWYWDYPKTAAGANWADSLTNKASQLGDAGFTMLWLPPLSRTSSGSWSNGYDPKDLYDYGEYNQGATGFGTRTDVNELVTALNGQGILPIADVVYNHRDGGAVEDNPGLKDYIVNFYDWSKADAGANPFPYDRMQVVLPLGGGSGNGAGDYYFKLRSKSQHSKFYDWEYKVYFETSQVGYQGAAIFESEDNGGVDCDPDEPFNTISLGRDINAQVDNGGCGIDEFKLSIAANDFNADGDAIFITFGNRNSGYSDMYIHGIWSVSRNMDIVDDLYYKTYTDYQYMPSGQGIMNWSNFKPNLDRSTNLSGDWDGMYFYYDYDQFQTDTRDKLFAWTGWNWSDIGIRGFRMDAIKHFTPEFVGDLLDNLHEEGMDPPMVVGEWYGTDTDELSGWVKDVYFYMDEDTKQAIAPRIFDFSLRDALRRACDEYGYDARNVFGASIVDQGKLAGTNVVTFANNHDFRGESSFASLIQNNPILAYTYLLTNNQIGLPTVFYPDFFGYEVPGESYYPPNKAGLKTQISQLMQIHQDYIHGANGRTYLNNDLITFPNSAGTNSSLMVYQIKGDAGFKDLVIAINFGGDQATFSQKVDGISVGTQLSELTGNSPNSVVSVEDANGISNSIWLDVPGRSYVIYRVGAWGLWNDQRSYAGFNVDGTSTPLTVWDNGAGNYQDYDFGTFTGSDVFELSSYDIKSWKSSGGDVTGGNLFYTIYPKGNRPDSPVFTSEVISLMEDIGGTQTGNQKWGFLGKTINLLEGLSAGEYTLEIYTKVDGTDPNKSEYDNNNGNTSNYTAHFRYNYVRSATDGEWSAAATWLDDVVPDAATISVEINHDVTLAGSRSINDLFIEAGSFTLNPEGDLSVNGSLTVSAAETSLFLQSNASATSSLIQSSEDVEATTQRFIAGQNDAVHGWHFLSSPVKSLPLADSDFIVVPAADYDFFSWSESGNLWLNQKIPGNSITGFVPGEAYLVSYKTEDTKDITGTLNIADIPISNLSHTGTSFYGGTHLLGNPFSSAIDWTSGSWNKSTSIGGEPQIWDADDASYKTLTDGIIPAHNGFMVYTGSSGGSLTIPADARVHSTQDWYKSQQESTDMILLTARDNEANTAQQTKIRLHPEATFDFDLQYDSYFITGHAPSFYSISGSRHFALNSLPANQDVEQIQLGFVGNENSDFAIEANILLEGSNVLLVDLKTNKVQNLNENPVYNFTSEAGDEPNRFLLKFSETGIDESERGSFSVFANSNQIIIITPENATSGTFEVFDLQGRLLFTEEFKPGFNSFSSPAKGLLVIRLTSGSKVVNKKVLCY